MKRAASLLIAVLTLAARGEAGLFSHSSKPAEAPTPEASAPDAPAAPSAAALSDVDLLPTFDAKPREDDVAVVIGIEKYRSVPPSQYSASDAKLMRDYLVAMGYPARNVEVRTDDLATLGDIKRVFERWLPNHVKPDSRVVIYYSGHGAPDPTSGKAYLVPWDGDPNYLDDTAYPEKQLEDTLAKLPAEQVIVILDACFSGAGKAGEGRTVLAEGARPMVVTAPEAPPKAANIAILSAARRSQISASNPDYRHGLLTYHLLKAIREGKKSMADIYAELRPRVEDDAKARNVDQSPQLLPELGPESSGKFLLADFKSVSIEAPKPKVSPEEAASLAAEKKRIMEEQKKLEAERRALREKQEAAERDLDAQKQRMAAEDAERRRQSQAAEAARREAEEERVREREAELDRRRRQIESQTQQAEPTFIPPSF